MPALAPEVLLRRYQTPKANKQIRTETHYKNARSLARLKEFTIHSPVIVRFQVQKKEVLTIRLKRKMKFLHLDRFNFPSPVTRTATNTEVEMEVNKILL